MSLGLKRFSRYIGEKTDKKACFVLRRGVFAMLLLFYIKGDKKKQSYTSVYRFLYKW